ncbi:MAG: hypothetical protein ACO3DT_07320 [Gammaproteobacteria bacterium]
MFKDALSVIPSRPVVFIAPVIVVLVLVFYYRDLHIKCSDIKQHRVALNEVLPSHERSAPFRLAEFTRFSWDKVRIVARLEPHNRTVECPFGWNWPSGERETLAASGLLSALMFAQQGTIVKYLEVRNDEVAFRGTDSSLTPQTAVFTVGSNSDDSSAVTLTLTSEN